MKKLCSIAIMLAIMLFCCTSAFAAKGQAKQVDRQSYMESCKIVDYKDVERNPNQFKGQDIVVKGKVIQVSEGWFDSVTMRVDEGSGNVWYVTYTRSDENESRILEGDNLAFYGKCDGVESYTSVLGGKITIPSLKAKMVSDPSAAVMPKSTSEAVPKAASTVADGWVCPNCGANATGNFCSNCAAPKPAPSNDSGDINAPENSSNDNNGIAGIMPSDGLWGTSIEGFPEAIGQSCEPCYVGKKQALKISGVNIDSYAMDGYYIFNLNRSGSSSLSKFAYILSETTKHSGKELKQCFETLVADMKNVLGEPDTHGKSVASWTTETYSVQIGAGKFSNYNGSEETNIGIVFKFEGTAGDNENPESESAAQQEDYKLLKEYRWSLGSYYYYAALVIQNTSGTTKDYDAQVMFLDKKGEIVGVGNFSADTVGNGQKALIECQNDSSFDHIEYTITAKDSYYQEVQSFVDIQVKKGDDKAIIIAKNTGSEPAQFVEYHCLFLDKDGNAVSSGWGYLTDDDFELKPGKSEFQEEHCYDPFKTIEVYFTGRAG